MIHLALAKAAESISVFFLCFHGWDSREVIARGTVWPVAGSYSRAVTQKCYIAMGEGSKLFK